MMVGLDFISIKRQANSKELLVRLNSNSTVKFLGLLSSQKFWARNTITLVMMPSQANGSRSRSSTHSKMMVRSDFSISHIPTKHSILISDLRVQS